MTTWFTRDPERLAIETALMEHGTRAVLRRTATDLMWVEDVRSTATGQLFTLAITYPERFPFEAPRGFILNPGIVGGAPHRFGDGSLCLFPDPRLADGPKTTALVVRNRAVVWFLAYEVWRVTGEWMAPQAH